MEVWDGEVVVPLCSLPVKWASACCVSAICVVRVMSADSDSLLLSGSTCETEVGAYPTGGLPQEVQEEGSTSATCFWGSVPSTGTGGPDADSAGVALSSRARFALLSDSHRSHFQCSK